MSTPSRAEVRGLMVAPPPLPQWEELVPRFAPRDWNECWPADSEFIAHWICQWMYGIGPFFKRVGCKDDSCSNPLHLVPQV